MLFVAEKRAALEVVKNRLTRAGLGEFCPELHSHKSQKSTVAASIGQRISNRGSYRQPSQLNDLINNYERLKQQLNDHVRQLHTLFQYRADCSPDPTCKPHACVKAWPSALPTSIPLAQPTR